MRLAQQAIFQLVEKSGVRLWEQPAQVLFDFLVRR
jgi:hypothetical protein